MQLILRTSKEPLAWAVPILCSYENLSKQFTWLGNGSVEHVIKKNLVKEIDVLEHYLLSINEDDIKAIIENGKREGQRYWADSGETYHWVCVFQAAELLWNMNDEEGCADDEEDDESQDKGKADASLFRMYEDSRKTVDDTSPYICIKLQDRYGYFYF